MITTVGIYILITGNIIGYNLTDTSQNQDSETMQYLICPNNCGRKYKQKGNLSVHLRLECGVPRKFKCEICGKAFTRNSSCKTHTITVHKVILSD